MRLSNFPSIKMNNFMNSTITITTFVIGACGAYVTIANAHS